MDLASTPYFLSVPRFLLRLCLQSLVVNQLYCMMAWICADDVECAQLSVLSRRAGDDEIASRQAIVDSQAVELLEARAAAAAATEEQQHSLLALEESQRAYNTLQETHIRTFSTLENELADVCEAKRALESTLADEIDANRSLVRELQQRHSELESKLVDVNEAKESLEREFEEYRSTFENKLVHAIDAKQALESEFSERNSELERKLHQAEVSVAQARDSLSASLKSRDTLLLEIADAQAHAVELRSTLAFELSQVTEGRDVLEHKLSSLSQQHADTLRELTQTRDDLASAIEARAVLEGELGRANAHIGGEGDKNMRVALEQELVKVRDALDLAVDAHNSLEGKLVEVRAKAATSLDRCSALERMLAEVETAHAEQVKYASGLESQLEVAISVRTSLEGGLAESRDRLATSLDRCSVLERELAEAGEVHAEQVEYALGLETQLEELLKRLEDSADRQPAAFGQEATALDTQVRSLLVKSNWRL